MTTVKTINSCDLDLEFKIRKLAIRANTFVIGFLDCCREIPDVTKKGDSEKIPDKVAGQLCLVHAVAPAKSAVAARNRELSEVTGEFLQVMKNAKLTFPSCIQAWAKQHKTVELIDKCTYEIKFVANSTLPPSHMISRSSNIEEWSVEEVCSWLSTLHLSHDISITFRNQNIDGTAFKSVLEGDLTWKEIGIELLGDIGKIKKALREQKLFSV